MVSFNTALKIIRTNIKPCPGETVPLSEARGRALIADLNSPYHFPPFSCSAYDGYAINATDVHTATSSTPVKLDITAMLVAGDSAEVSIGKGQAVRIMTGAPMPHGADAVVKQEDVVSKGDSLWVKQPIKRGGGVRTRGCEAVKGKKIFSKGDVMGPEELGFLASLGAEKVEVYSKPEVAIMMIGDELVAPGASLPPGKIHAGNSLMFSLLVRKYGGLPVYMGIIPDSQEKIAGTMRRANGARIVLTAGGSGKGIHDLTGYAFESAGGRFLFQGVNIWPGGTLSLGLLNDVPFFMLPGGPRTGSICFHLFVREALNLMCPWERNGLVKLNATMLSTLTGRSGMTNYMHVSFREGIKANYAVGSHSSALAGGRSALAVLPPGVKRVERGDDVEVILL